MSKVCESWSLKDLDSMTEQDMDRLLGFYETNKVPDPLQLQGHERRNSFEFDGSFGWAL